MHRNCCTVTATAFTNCLGTVVNANKDSIIGWVLENEVLDVAVVPFE